jgi:transposase
VALRGELTMAQLAAKNGIHQTIVGKWKRQAVEGIAGVFSGKSAAQESAKATEADFEKLHAKIGHSGARALRSASSLGRTAVHELHRKFLVVLPSIRNLSTPTPDRQSALRWRECRGP